MSAIGIIVVTYNSADEIGACLDAAIATGAEIVVVDNASRDDTLAEVRRRPVRLIANSGNRGFAGAVNQAVAALDTAYILLLNPDAVILTSLEPLREACDLPQSAGAGGKLVGADGQPQAGFMARSLPGAATLALEVLLLNRLLPANPVNRRYRCVGWDFSTTRPVEQPAGAFLMLRREVWLEVGGLDERFFPLWFEDVDLCRELANRGYRLFFAPGAVARHTGGHSIPSLPLEKRLLYWYGGLLRYAAKRFGPMEFRAVCLAVVVGAWLRGVAETARYRGIRPLAAYAKVAGLAARSLWFGCCRQ
jgi:N-acetylglucosaminyl-diphospho-decaprenol L-rhamnosyltransferase